MKVKEKETGLLDEYQKALSVNWKAINVAIH